MPNETTGLYEAFPRSGHIWLIDALTGRVQTVLTEGENLSWATFSPDGQELLYVDGPPLEPQGVLSAVPPRPWRLMLFQRHAETHTELLRGDRGFLWATEVLPRWEEDRVLSQRWGESLALSLRSRDSRGAPTQAHARSQENLLCALRAGTPVGTGWTRGLRPRRRTNSPRRFGDGADRGRAYRPGEHSMWVRATYSCEGSSRSCLRPSL
jgi:hypothetical protein